MTAQGAIANYSLLIILESHIATLLGMTARSAKKWAVLLSQQTALTQWTQTIINFLHHKISFSAMPTGCDANSLHLPLGEDPALLLTF